MKFFESLRRLLEPRTRPPTERIEQPSADRPPPAGTAPSEVPALRDESPLDVTSAVPVIPTSDEIAEVRAALEAVAEVPASAPEPEAQVAPQAFEPTPLFPPASMPTSARPSEEEPVDAPTATGESVGDALVLALATPAKNFSVLKASATLGRGQENTFRLDDLSVSRRHARITYRQGGYWLSDLGSMGGTWVDGTRLTAPHRIAAGQVIDIGLCRLTVSFAGVAASAEAKKSASKPRSEVAVQGRRRR